VLLTIGYDAPDKLSGRDRNNQRSLLAIMQMLKPMGLSPLLGTLVDGLARYIARLLNVN
jgi:hypothetical protein